MKHKYSLDWLKSKFEKEEKLKFLFFWGHTKKYNEEVGGFCLSQWYESPFVVEDIKYRTAEHWMMAKKAKLFNDEDIFKKIIKCEKPAEAKDLGRKIVGFDELVWVKHRFEIVVRGNFYKFKQNEKLRNYLLNTGDRILVEASPVDNIWGIGLAKDAADITNVDNWRGLNLLGFALMEVRDELRSYSTI